LAGSPWFQPKGGSLATERFQLTPLRGAVESRFWMGSEVPRVKQTLDFYRYFCLFDNHSILIRLGQNNQGTIRFAAHAPRK
jgi:hypothetical protein